MSIYDPFREIAHYYDRIMDHVNYDRWFAVTTALGELMPHGFTHVDVACGTGVLLKRLLKAGWNSFGADLSQSMLVAGKNDAKRIGFPVVAADLRALPFCASIDYVTCLFDSVNFLLEFDGLAKAFREISATLKPNGLFYFDVVTERMVTEHFEGQEWTERHSRFSSTWRSSYCRKTHVSETLVRISGRAGGVFSERVYSQEEIEQALAGAGLTLLGAFDAHMWKSPGRRTVRIDYVVAKEDSRQLRKRFGVVCAALRRHLA